MQRQLKHFFILSIFITFATVQVCYAEDALSRADAAVANILFEYDGSEQFASYSISERGDVNITFAENMPDELYAEIVTKLSSHPDIHSVLAGKGGPSCGFF